MSHLQMYKTSRLEQFFLAAVCCFFILLAFVINFRLTTGLTWPYDVDHMRDIGAAQSILDGNWGADPIYLGEGAWYPPLMPTILAALEAMTGIELPTLSARAPVFINLFAPVTFTFMTWKLLGARIATISLAAFLFMSYNPDENWLQLYSAWGFPINTVLPLLFLGVVFVNYASNSNNKFVWLYSGIFVGFCCLAHTAIALLLFTLFLSSVTKTPITSRQLLTEASIKFLIFITGILILAFPFLSSTYFRYFHGPLNLAPQNWLDPTTLSLNFAAPFSIVITFALLGAIFLWRSRHLYGATLIILKMIGWSLFFFAWAQISCIAFANGEKSLLPSLVPSFHFLLFLYAGVSILFGAGLIGITEKVVPQGCPEVFKKLCLVSIVILLVIYSLYTNRPWERLNWQRNNSLEIMSEERKNLYHWILRNSNPNTVFSTNSFNLAELMVMPSGRKLVATTSSYFSNPFVDWGKRARLNNELLNNIISADVDSIATNVSQTGVEYLLDSSDNKPFLRAQQLGIVSLVAEIGGIRIYKVTCC